MKNYYNFTVDGLFEEGKDAPVKTYLFPSPISLNCIQIKGIEYLDKGGYLIIRDDDVRISEDDLIKVFGEGANQFFCNMDIIINTEGFIQKIQELVPKVAKLEDKYEVDMVYFNHSIRSVEGLIFEDGRLKCIMDNNGQNCRDIRETYKDSYEEDGSCYELLFIKDIQGFIEDISLYLESRCQFVEDMLDALSEVMDKYEDDDLFDAISSITAQDIINFAPSILREDAEEYISLGNRYSYPREEYNHQLVRFLHHNGVLVTDIIKNRK